MRKARSEVDSGTALGIHQIQYIEIICHDVECACGNREIHVLAVVRIAGNDVVLRQCAFQVAMRR